MTDAATKPRRNTLYDRGYYAWTQEQARLLRERRWNDLDLENLVDEVETVGRSDKYQIESRMEVLLAHLLKWKYQPGRRGSWSGTVSEQRRRLIRLIEDSPSLKEFAWREASEGYQAGRLLAAKETGMAISLLPEECPWTPEQVLDPDLWPEDPSAE